MSEYTTSIPASYYGEDVAAIKLSIETSEENKTLVLYIIDNSGYESNIVEVDIDEFIWTLKQIKATSAKIREMEENYNPDLEK